MGLSTYPLPLPQGRPGGLEAVEKNEGQPGVLTVAVHGIYVDIRRIRLGTETVVADVHPCPLNSQVLDVEGVPEVGVGRQYAGIVGDGGYDDVFI